MDSQYLHKTRSAITSFTHDAFEDICQTHNTLGEPVLTFVNFEDHEIAKESVRNQQPILYGFFFRTPT